MGIGMDTDSDAGQPKPGQKEVIVPCRYCGKPREEHLVGEHEYEPNTAAEPAEAEEGAIGARIPCRHCGIPQQDHTTTMHEYEAEPGAEPEQGEAPAEEKPEPQAREKKPGWEILSDCAESVVEFDNPLHATDREKAERLNRLAKQCESRTDEIIPDDKREEVVRLVLGCACTASPIVGGDIIRFAISQMGVGWVREFAEESELVLVNLDQDMDNLFLATEERLEQLIRTSKRLLD